MKNILVDILNYAINASSGENYRPWKVNVDDFYKITDEHEKLKFLLGFAVLAPSGHNSQPWNFVIKDRLIKIFKNKERSLSGSDPEERLLEIAMGCVLENILIVADYFGMKTDVNFFQSSENREFIAVKFIGNESVENNKDHLIYYIAKRCTNRNKYKNRMPNSQFLVKIKNLSSNDITVSVVDNQDLKKKYDIADIVSEAQVKVMNSDSFREELSHYIKSNYTKAKLGMPGFVLGIPGLISIFASGLIKRFNLSKKTFKQDNALLKLHTPVFIIISSNVDSTENRIKVGQVFEKIWLMAEREGLNCFPLAAAIQLDDCCYRLQNAMGSKNRPLVFFRMGYPTKKSRHSPRLNIDDVLIS